MKKKLYYLIQRVMIIIIISFFSTTTMAQGEGNEDCKMLIDWVAEKPEGTFWATWSYRLDDVDSEFIVVDNPHSSGPVSAAQVRKWTKGPGWDGIGANTNDESLVSLEDYKYLSVWVYSEREMMDLLRLELMNTTLPEGKRIVIDYKAEYLGISHETWYKVQFPIDDILAEGATKAFNKILMNPDGTNDSPKWINNPYYFYRVYLESETGCPDDATSIGRDFLFDQNKNKKPYFIYGRTLYFREQNFRDLIVFSVSGQKMIELSNPKNSVFLSDLKQGLYLITFSDAENNFYSGKILVR
jgi:hypothetical protein